MTFDEYDRAVDSTAVYPEQAVPRLGGMMYCTLGLVGEAGEFAEKMKKVIRDHEGFIDQETREAMALELGDQMWYISRLAGYLSYTIEDIAMKNAKKLADRKQRNILKGGGDNR